MPVVLQLICFILAAVCFALGALGVNTTRRPLNLIALGLLAWVLVPLWTTAAAL